MDTKTITQLSKLFRARFPYIYITTWEEDRAISLIKKMAKSEKLIRIPRECIFGHKQTALCLMVKKLKELKAQTKQLIL